MESGKVTLKDLAKAMGVSTATVHRALHGKAGVGDKTTAQIKQLAATMGYHTNYIAAALKRKKLQFAIVFPEPTQDSRYYYRSMWAGARKLFAQVQEFNAQVHEIAYPLTPASHGAALHALCETRGSQLDGVVTLAVDHETSATALACFAARGVPFTLVGADLHQKGRLCCVKSRDEAAGGLGAELLTAFHGPQFAGEIILTGNPVGSFSMLDQYYNVRGFEAYLMAHCPQVSFFSAYHSDALLACEQIRLLLETRPNVYAIYSSSARHSVRVAELLLSMGLAGKIKLVGNDVFPESRQLLQQGVVTAIIDKKVEAQSYEAARVLFHYIVKNETPSQAIVSICPEVIMRSNC